MRFILPVIWGLLAIASPVSFGHQQKETLSTVLFNARSGQLEIAHRFYIHDAEHAVKTLIDRKADLMASSNTQLSFGEYVKNKFSIKVDNRTLTLQYVGHEVEGKFFWVYQEAILPKDAVNIDIRHKALWELWPAQRNIVNIEKAGKTRSLQFVKGDDWKSLTLW